MIGKYCWVLLVSPRGAYMEGYNETVLSTVKEEEDDTLLFSVFKTFNRKTISKDKMQTLINHYKLNYTLPTTV
jgi:hypothetical protein